MSRSPKVATLSLVTILFLSTLWSSPANAEWSSPANAEQEFIPHSDAPVATPPVQEITTDPPQIKEPDTDTSAALPVESVELDKPATKLEEQASPPNSQSPQLSPVVQPKSTAKPNISITDPNYRDRKSSAYVLQRHQIGLNLGLFGLDSGEVLATVGVGYGFGHGFQVSANIAHMSAGLFNLSLKWQFLEKGPFALAVGFDPLYAHGDWVWIAGKNNVFSGLDMWSLPFSLSGSLLATPWLQFDLLARYVESGVVAYINSNSVALDADLAVRQFTLTPGVRFHVLKRTTFYAHAKLPLYTGIPASAQTEVNLTPGVVAGGQVSGTRTVPFSKTYKVSMGLRSMLSKHAFLDFGVNLGPLSKTLYHSYFYPYMGMELRF